MPCLNAKLSALALVAPLIGCASKPEAGRYIVLHTPASAPKVAEHRPAQRSVRKTAVATSSNATFARRAQTAGTPNAPVREAVPAADAQSLTPAEKDELFRRFEAYLNKPGHE